MSQDFQEIEDHWTRFIMPILVESVMRHSQVYRGETQRAAGAMFSEKSQNSKFSEFG